MSRRSLTTFVLILCFGVLFVGCSSAPEPDTTFEDLTFTDQDLQKVEEISVASSSSSSLSTETLGDDLTTTTMSSSSTGTPELSVSSAGMQTTGLTSSSAPLVVDSAKQKLYDNIRTAVTDQGGDVYRVNNPFLNVRSSMQVTATQIDRLNQGDMLTVLEIPNAGWAKVRLQNGKEGYVSFRYLAKVTTEQRLPEEKKQFEGKYFVDYAFLNIRREPSTQAEKVAELPGQSIVKPISMNGEWARVNFDGKEGYVSTQYLKQFLPVFLVRQDGYTVPVLQYNADDTVSIAALPKHIASLKSAGKKITTLKNLYDIVVAQETKDVRISPDTVILTVASVNAKNVRQVSDALQSAGVGATLFLQTKDIGMTGITEKMVLTLLANGNDLQSGGHTGDDLRSMTDSEVSLELSQSKKLIEDLTRREVYAIGYSRGGVNDRVMSTAGSMAYLFGVSQFPDKHFSRAQLLRLPSFVVTSGMTAEDIVKLAQ